MSELDTALLEVTHAPPPVDDARIARARELLDAGADPDAARQHPEFGALSALYGAVGVARSPELTRLLLDRGADPDDGESVYHATEVPDHTCLRLLLDAGARVAGTNAVAHMLDRDDLEGLRLLLEAGAAQEGAGWLADAGLVRWALGRDRSRAHLELLLEHGARPGPGDVELAVRRGRTDLADLLGTASPSPADELLGAVRRADRDEVDAVLGRHPGLLDRLGRGDHDVLVHAAGLGHAEAARMMLDLGFPVDVRSEDFEETPLHAAAWYGRAAMVELLLAAGADPAAPAGPPVGGPPLVWAEHGAREASAFDPPGAREPADHERVIALLRAAGG